MPKKLSRAHKSDAHESYDTYARVPTHRSITFPAQSLPHGGLERDAYA